ncbi:hypothetical protein KRM28CT15_27100 [Krasilnikovia sp. M28-CT-15]
MTIAPRRRAALLAIAAATAVGTGVAVRAWRRKPGAERQPAVVATAPSQQRHDRAMPAATRVRRNWTGLIAVPAVAILVLVLAQIATWPAPPRPHPVEGAGYDLIDRDAVLRHLPKPTVASEPTYPSPFPSSSPSPSPDVPVERECPPSAGRTTRFPVPSGAAAIVRQGLRVRPCDTLALGATATITRFADQRVKVTTSLPLDQKALRLPNGRHRVWVRLNIRNVGTSALPTPFPFVWAATRGAGWTAPTVSTDNGYWLDPGEERNQFAAFDVRGNVRLSRIRLSLYPGRTAQTMDWKIG